MVERNRHLSRLKASYLFPEIQARKRAFLQAHPEAKLISLGIGDTTEPLPEFVAKSLERAAGGFSTREKYFGYGPEQGMEALRHKIASRLYHGQIEGDEVFISDGAKCDIARLQVLFGSDISIAVQDPAYPVYVEGSLIQGVKKIIFMPCLPANDFFPDLKKMERTDLIYFCSPNNPTGAVATRAQLEKLVQFAKKNHSIIVFDSAYASYIQDPTLPRSIYEIPGAKEVAIETSSFSKMAGFTGVRLGWTIVPKTLTYSDGSFIHNDWNRITTTLFNGASNISQQGGLAVLEPEGWLESQRIVVFYLENARLIKEALHSQFPVFGGVNAPYLWVQFQQDSWKQFQNLLEKAHIVATPGSGFGTAGEGFMRFSAFGNRADIVQACSRLRTYSE